MSYYTITIPENVTPGSTFQAMVNNQLVTVTCPHDAVPGKSITIQLANAQPQYAPQQAYPTYAAPPPQAQRPRPRIETASWACLDLVVFICFILACTLGPYATQEISNNCAALNPYTGGPLTKTYYYLYKGLSSSSSNCDKSHTDFCLLWQNEDAWATFNHVTFSSQNQPDTQSSWTAAQVLIPFAVFFSFMALCMHIAGNNSTLKLEEQFNYLVSGGHCLMWAWIVGLIAQVFPPSTASMSASAWSQFYQNGYQILNLITADTTPGTPVSNCGISIYLTGGGIALSVGLSLCFFTSFCIMISACFLQKYVSNTPAMDPYATAYNNPYGNPYAPYPNQNSQYVYAGATQPQQAPVQPVSQGYVYSGATGNVQPAAEPIVVVNQPPDSQP